MQAKIWKIRRTNEKLSDEELIEKIKDGSIKGDDYIATNDIKVWIQVKESIYQYYLKEGQY